MERSLMSLLAEMKHACQPVWKHWFYWFIGILFWKSLWDVTQEFYRACQNFRGRWRWVIGRWPSGWCRLNWNHRTSRPVIHKNAINLDILHCDCHWRMPPLWLLGALVWGSFCGCLCQQMAHSLATNVVWMNHFPKQADSFLYH